MKKKNSGIKRGAGGAITKSGRGGAIKIGRDAASGRLVTVEKAIQRGISQGSDPKTRPGYEIESVIPDRRPPPPKSKK